MAEPASFEFISWGALPEAAREEAGVTLVALAGPDLEFSRATEALLGPALTRIRDAASLARFKGRVSTSLELYGLAGIGFPRLLLVGCGSKKGKPGSPVMPPGEKGGSPDYAALGGYAMGKAGSGRICVAFDPPGRRDDFEGAAADFLLGMRLRSYRFDLYKTKESEGEDEEPGAAVRVALAVPDLSLIGAKAQAKRAVAEGVVIARDLVNEPPNVLYPAEFAQRCRRLADVGVEVEIFDETQLGELGMRALLGVGQGSSRESRMVVMTWRGGGGQGAPLAFIGKGVCFDTGGISIKSASGMQDMKGDMAGAACVVGLMHALAARKAKVDVVGAIGLVENMPDGEAQRPGDIVKTCSGQTVEIVNTDAEGRLVLADVLWYVREKYGPRFMIDLATLTGAILVALGAEYAGLFSNDDELARRLAESGEAVGEKVWRMPLASAYDKLIDSKFADMKNVGGRHAGSIIAAQFLQRFVKEAPWAHLDIAGTGMGAPQSDVNASWGSGWGVRLLDRLVADYYES